MFDNHDAVLCKLAASGKQQFSLEELKAVMGEVWEEGAAQHERDLMQTDKLYDYYSDPESVNLLDQLPPSSREELEL